MVETNAVPHPGMATVVQVGSATEVASVATQPMALGLDMSPSPPVLNVLDHRFPDPEPFGQGTLRGSLGERCSNCAHVVGGELGRSISLALVVARWAFAPGERVAPVVGGGTDVEMLWADASAHVAAMEDVQAGRDRPDKQFPSEPVCSRPWRRWFTS